MRKLKKVFSLTLALALSLALAVPAFAAESKWKLEVPGKSNAEIFVGKKTFTLRDCGMYDYNPSIDKEIFYKEDDLQWTAEKVCVLAKGDTAVFTYTYKDGYAYSTEVIDLTAWSDPDKDGVFVKRSMEMNYEDDYSDGQNGYADLLPGNKYEVLPVGSPWTGDPWSASVNRDEEGRHEVRLSADRVLELFGPNTLVGFSNRGMYTSDPADMDWFILVEGNASQTTEPDQPTEPENPTTPTGPSQPEQPTEPAAPATPDAPGTYTVKKGDTWSSICINFYGTNAQRYALQKANKGVTLKEGAVITLPEKLGKDTLLPAPAAAEGEKLYTVKLGDTLGRIAAAEYGKAAEYKAIFQRNADRLKNANTIYEGQVIVLPVNK